MPQVPHLLQDDPTRLHFLALAVSLRAKLKIALQYLWRPAFLPLHLFFKTTWGRRAFGVLDWQTGWFDHVWIHTRISKSRQFSTRAPFHSCSVRSSHWGCNLSWMQSGRTLPHENTRIMVYQENTQNRQIPHVRRSCVVATSEDFLNVIDPRDHLLLPTLVPIRVQRETLAKLIASLPERRCLKGIAGWYANIAWLSDLVSWLVNVTNTVCSSKIGKKIFAKNGIFGCILRRIIWIKIQSFSNSIEFVLSNILQNIWNDNQESTVQ